MARVRIESTEPMSPREAQMVVALAELHLEMSRNVRLMAGLPITEEVKELMAKDVVDFMKRLFPDLTIRVLSDLS
jgi:hypothetical protein